MACSACHAAKVKCVNPEGLPCTRCKRLDLECILHKSRQGQGKKRRKKRVSSDSNMASATSSLDGSASMPVVDDASATTTTAVKQRGLKRNAESADSLTKSSKNSKAITESVIVSNAAKLGPNHFGLYFIIRQWVAFAITRRSFNLLGRACSLACKCGISMDDIICGCERFSSIPTVDEPVSSANGGTNNANPLFMALAIRTRTSHGLGSGMDFLSEVTTQPGKDQNVIGPALQLTEIPLKLLSSIYCCPSLSNLSGRWVLVREMKNGISRFFVSQQFEQDIAPYDLIHRTYQENQIEVKDLWTKNTEDKYKHSQGLIHQISMQKTYDTSPHPARICNTKITLRSGQEIACDCIICMVIVGLDHCYYFVEYHSPRPIDDGNVTATSSSNTGNNNILVNNNNDQSAVAPQNVSSMSTSFVGTATGRPTTSETNASRNAVLNLSSTNVLNMANLMLANNQLQQQRQQSAGNGNMNTTNMLQQQQQNQQQRQQQQQQRHISSSNQANLVNFQNNNNNNNNTMTMNNSNNNIMMMNNNNNNNNMGGNMMQSNAMNMAMSGNTLANNRKNDYNAMVDDLEWSSDLDGWLSEMEMKNLW